MSDVHTYFDFQDRPLFLTHQDISPSYMETKYINNDGYELDRYGEIADEYETVEVEEMAEDEAKLYQEWIHS